MIQAGPSSVCWYSIRKSRRTSRNKRSLKENSSCKFSSNQLLRGFISHSHFVCLFMVAVLSNCIVSFGLLQAQVMRKLIATFLCCLLLLKIHAQVVKAPEIKEGEGPYTQLILRGLTLINSTGAPPVG